MKNFQKIILTRFTELKSESNIDKADIQFLIQTAQEQFDLLDDINKKSVETVHSLNLEALNSFSRESEVLLDNRGPEPKLYMKAG